MTYRFIQCSAAASFILLTACGGGSSSGTSDGGGGGGGGETPQTTPFVDTGGTETVSISAVSLNSGLRMTGTETGEFDQNADTFTLGALSGAINAAGDTVTIDADGSRINIIAGSTEHAARFIATSGFGVDDRTIGIVGFETAIDDLPTGSVSYTGTSELVITDKTQSMEEQSVYRLTGDATIRADFAGGLVDTTLDNLSGTVAVRGNTPTDVTDVATITFTGSAIDGAQFTGGTAVVSSPTLSSLSGDETSSLNGGFYGPGADEAGATFIIDDDAANGVTVLGTILAD